jgi:hypothetical protein
MGLSTAIGRGFVLANKLLPPVWGHANRSPNPDRAAPAARRQRNNCFELALTERSTSSRAYMGVSARMTLQL